MNIFLRSFIEDGHEITTEDDIFEALKCRGGVAGTTAMLLYESTLNGTIVQKNFKAAKISQSTHEVRWDNAVAEVYEASNISTTDIIEAKSLDNYVNNNVSVRMKRVFTSRKPL